MDAREQEPRYPGSGGLVLCSLVLAWCLGLIAVRVFRTGSGDFLFLAWNLFLACIPLALSLTAVSMSRRGASRLAQGTLFFFWLLFLPNAPYIITDLVHVVPPTGIRSWYDTGTVLSCAAAGLLMGYLSVRDMQQLVEDRFGKTAGWSMVGAASMLSGFGVYLGRVMRWNSWDAVTNPVAFFSSIADLLVNAPLRLHTYAMTFLFGLGLLLGYAVLRFLAATERNVRGRL